MRTCRASESVARDVSHFQRRDTRMTRVHFRIIAEGLAASRPYSVIPSERNQWWACCESMANRLSRTNPNFDRERFLMWCSET